MAEDWENQLISKSKDSIRELSRYNFISTIYDPQTREDLIQTQFNMIPYYISTGKIKQGTDPYDIAQMLSTEQFGSKEDVYVVPTDKKVNFAVNPKEFAAAGLDPELAEYGANILIGNMDEANKDGNPFKWAIFKELGEQHQIMMPVKELEKRKKELELAGILHGRDVQKYLTEQITQDLIDGNAHNLERAIIPASNGEGYQIGIFYIPEDGSSEDGILIGAMLDGDKFRHITHEELVGASASEHLLEYVTSNYFDYSHKNVQRLKEEGQEIEEIYTWRAKRVSDWYPQFFEEMGKLEFQYTIKPLSDMLEKKASEKFGKKYRPGKDFLSDAEAHIVLESYMDRLDRFYKADYVPDFLKPKVRNISNWWSVDMRVSELFYED